MLKWSSLTRGHSKDHGFKKLAKRSTQGTQSFSLPLVITWRGRSTSPFLPRSDGFFEWELVLRVPQITTALTGPLALDPFVSRIRPTVHGREDGVPMSDMSWLENRP
eukprot:TRINITY_DN869_c0_g1_i31.p2 TRINITY_DN869_c0_g1~~TRINITY_DN869_c0_g1_i31.p2  ORF type:complete len:107 (+),score=4.68 TRINITY_DN869_c0_g1_i31:341-661(+)